MKNKLIWLTMLSVLIIGGAMAQSSPQPGDDGIGDRFYPQLGNGGYDVQHYTLDLTVDMETNHIDAVTTIEATTTEALSTFNLDLVGLDVTGIDVNGESARFQRRAGELTIKPEQPLEKSADFTVTVTYGGTPTTITNPSLYREGWLRIEDAVYVFGEPFGASTFYPVNDHPLDKATYTFAVTVAEPYTVAANGLLQDTVENDDGTRTFIWESRDPIASYLVVLGIAEFQVKTETGPDDLPIRSYFPIDAGATVTAPFERTAEMIEVFSEKFGPYPFEAYGAMVMHINFSAALETQTLSTFGRTTFEYVVAHELVHQWFGDSVSLSAWEDIWLNEGFATYGELIWNEYLHGYDAMIEDAHDLYDFAVASNLHAPGFPSPNELFNRAVYVRGALVLHALRMEVGDDVFFNILRTYHERFAYGNATTADFIAIAEELSGDDLANLFDAWLYSETMPEFPQ